MSAARRAQIYYKRLPHDEKAYQQPIALEREDVIVSVTEPLVVDRSPPEGAGPMLETGSRVVWFTFPGCWHDVGRFYAPDGAFRGYYTNILTPPQIVRDAAVTTWRTTDLFLDLWCPVTGSVMVLDEDELEDALAHGHIEASLALSARREADRLLALARAGAWPPGVVKEWTLERALEATAD